MIRGVATALALLLLACGGQSQLTFAPDVVVPDTPPVTTPVELTALVPSLAGKYSPSHMAFRGHPTVDGKYIANAQACGACHTDVMAQWDTSAHSFSSFSNPIYRVAVDGFRKQIGNKASRFCGGCHDVALQTDRVMVKAVSPEDPRAHAGITCQTCHGVESVSRDGNGSFALRSSKLPLPTLKDKQSVARHVKTVTRRRLGDELCVSCHRSFVGTNTGNGAHLAGMDDFAAWESSGFSGSGASRVDKVAPRGCIDCHMRKVDARLDDPAADKHGKISSHRFLGGHTWLASMRKDADALRANKKFLRGIASIDIASIKDDRGRQTLLADGAPVQAGRELRMDVVVRNLSVGHRFPGGVLDAQDTWIELTVRDAAGKIVASAGVDHATKVADHSTHVFRALLADKKGDIRYQRQVHTFAGRIVNHAIAPRDAVATRFAFRLPKKLAGLALPLRIDARLLHRTRNLELQRASCAAHKTRRGRRFASRSLKVRGVAIDPCTVQPITEVAKTSAAIGHGWKSVHRAKETAGWRRLYEHGMALNHAVQEQIGEARPSLLAALKALAGKSGAAAAFNRAKVYTALGKLSGRQGRTADALAFFDKAEVGAPGHPAIDVARAKALTRVWRWKHAVAPLKRASVKAPRNLAVWRALAIALGSSGDDAGALTAAKSGLALSPRDADLLRVQSLSLTRLGAPANVSKIALDAFGKYRRPDRASDIRMLCTAKSRACARERNPVHVHRMKQK